MFWSKNKKNKVYEYLCKPHFFHIKVGFKGYTFHRHVFLMKDDFEVRLSDVKNVQHHNCLLINLLILVKFEKVCRHIVEPHHEKTGFFRRCENIIADQLCNKYVFATQKVQSLPLLNPNFQASIFFYSETVNAGMCRTWSETRLY